MSGSAEKADMSVRHDEGRRRFSVQLGEYEAALMYARRGDVLDFYHIYVPEPYRDRGVAGRILAAAFDYAREHKLGVVPSCPFIRGEFVPRFERYQDLVRDEGAFPFAERGA